MLEEWTPILPKAGKSHFHYKARVISKLWENSAESGTHSNTKTVHPSEPGMWQSCYGKLPPAPSLLHIPEAGIPSMRFCEEVLKRAFTQSLATLQIRFHDALQELFSLSDNKPWGDLSESHRKKTWDSKARILVVTLSGIKWWSNLNWWLILMSFNITTTSDRKQIISCSKKL